MARRERSDFAPRRSESGCSGVLPVLEVGDAGPANAGRRRRRGVSEIPGSESQHLVGRSWTCASRSGRTASRRRSILRIVDVEVPISSASSAWGNQQNRIRRGFGRNGIFRVTRARYRASRCQRGPTGGAVEGIAQIVGFRPWGNSHCSDADVARPGALSGCAGPCCTPALRGRQSGPLTV